MELGHVRAGCTSLEDRTGACYRCGRTGHLAGSCAEPVMCPACAQAGLSSGHRIGAAKSCVATRKRKPGGRAKRAAESVPQAPPSGPGTAVRSEALAPVPAGLASRLSGVSSGGAAVSPEVNMEIDVLEETGPLPINGQ
ncbi:uncharacterized protein [Mycetomoellerius zeteki]|uniref:uncharacterized protein n=1 Tax=Mycetomoellerius zeteki TaxID=64791 RepID=UPI00084E53DB|nr:PREDICTED: uncharacterized protein LOC108728681 [Trachymyrmex zeteki]